MKTLIGCFDLFSLFNKLEIAQMVWATYAQCVWSLRKKKKFIILICIEFSIQSILFLILLEWVCLVFYIIWFIHHFYTAIVNGPNLFHAYDHFLAFYEMRWFQLSTMISGVGSVFDDDSILKEGLLHSNDW